jgi:ADP-ribose pyrophosphatase
LPVRDQPAAYPVTASETVFQGRIWDVVAEQVTLPGGTSVRREYVVHPGAVAVIAVDDAGRVLLQRQYRHPVRAELWEPPAGLLDVPGEPPILTAQRELWEEADLQASDWRHLLTFNTTPGGVSEVLHVFLARGLSSVAKSQQFSREEEEAALVPVWLPLEEAADLVLQGALSSPSAVVGLLAASRAARLEGGWDALPVAS